MKRALILSVIYFFFANSASGLELCPWFEENYKLMVRPSYTYNTFDTFALGYGTQKTSSYNRFYNLNFFMTPFDDISTEFEFGIFDTSMHSTNFEYARFCIRYLLLNDITAKDFLSLSFGAIITTPVKEAIYDINTFHHWYLDAEVNIAIGKEFSCNKTWQHRFYILGGIASGTRGSMWAHGLFVLEKNICDKHFFRIFSDCLKGLGKNNLDNIEFFNGYAGLAHKSLDIGIGYSYEWFSYARISLDILQRVYARNFPQNPTSAIIALTIPLSF
jgi:hypothetical protein